MKTVIMGLGQEWRAEDSFGIRVVDWLKKDPEILKYRCDILSSQGNITQIIDILQSSDYLLLIDAIKINEDNSEATRAPFVEGGGSRQLIVASFEEILEKTWIEKKIGTHFFSLKEIYLTAKVLGWLRADVTFLGLPIHDFRIEKLPFPELNQEFFSEFTDQIQCTVLSWLQTIPKSSGD